MQPVPGFWVYPILGECTAVQFVARSCSTLASTVASMFGVGASGSLAHAAVATTATAASKAITLLNRVAIAGYYTRAVGRPWWKFWRKVPTTRYSNGGFQMATERHISLDEEIRGIGIMTLFWFSVKLLMVNIIWLLIVLAFILFVAFGGS